MESEDTPALDPDVDVRIADLTQQMALLQERCDALEAHQQRGDIDTSDVESKVTYDDAMLLIGPGIWDQADN